MTPSALSLWIVAGLAPRGAGEDRGVAVGIEDPHGSLTVFHLALERTEADEPGAVTRVLHMGDSSIGLDGLPHALRRRMQDRFGDAGTGFVNLSRYSQNYKNRTARIPTDGGWDVCYLAYLCVEDGRYGLGGHVFRTRRGAKSTIGNALSGWGSRASHFEVWYAQSPGAGNIAVRIDDGEELVLETDAPQVADQIHTLEVEPGVHEITVRAAGGPRASVYGVVMENEGPGVVWDTISMIGAFTKRLHGYDETHIARQVQLRDADLLVLNFGGNDLRRLVSRAVTPDEYGEELRRGIKAVRAGKREMSCLVASVIDHGRSGSYEVLPEHVDAMVEAQRKVTLEEGCAFFDSVAAMGGAGTLKKWRKLDPPLAELDFKHLNDRGRELMGGLMYAAILRSYEDYRARH